MTEAVFPDNLLVHQGVFEKAYRENDIIYHQVLFYFDKHIDRILNRKNVTVFDVGANIGLFSMEVLRRSGGQANVYCFEPLPATYGKLAANLEQLNLPNVHLFNYGLGEAEMTVTFQYNRFADSMSSRYEMFGPDEHKMAMSVLYNKQLSDKFHANVPGFYKYLPRFLNSAMVSLFTFLFLRTAGKRTPVECKLTTLSKIIADQKIEKIDLLKVDVEKAEMDVLMGIAAADWRKIDAIVLEVHDIDDRAEEIRKLLTRHGFNRIEVDKLEAGQVAFSMSGFREATLPAT